MYVCMYVWIHSIEIFLPLFKARSVLFAWTIQRRTCVEQNVELYSHICKVFLNRCSCFYYVDSCYNDQLICWWFYPLVRNNLKTTFCLFHLCLNPLSRKQPNLLRFSWPVIGPVDLLIWGMNQWQLTKLVVARRLPLYSGCP